MDPQIVDRRPEEKRCSRCGVIKKREEFSTDRGQLRKDGTVSLLIRWECLACNRDAQRRDRADPRIRAVSRLKQRLYSVRQRANIQAASERYRISNSARLAKAKRRRRQRFNERTRAPIVLRVVSWYYEIDESTITAKGLKNSQTMDWTGHARLTCIYLLGKAFAYIHEKTVADMMGMDRSTILHHWETIPRYRKRRNKEDRLFWETVMTCRMMCLDLAKRGPAILSTPEAERIMWARLNLDDPRKGKIHP